MSCVLEQPSHAKSQYIACLLLHKQPQFSLHVCMFLCENLIKLMKSLLLLMLHSHDFERKESIKRAPLSEESSPGLSAGSTSPRARKARNLHMARKGGAWRPAMPQRHRPVLSSTQCTFSASFPPAASEDSAA